MLAADLESITAVEVSLLPVPAITGILPFVFSATKEIVSQCSFSERVAASPVVPHTIIASVPF